MDREYIDKPGSCMPFKTQQDLDNYVYKRAVVGHPDDWAMKVAPDMVNHPPHYTSHPSGIECIQITEHMGFNLGNALKYVWRADLKNDAVEDMKKAVFYINREIAKREKK